MAYNVRVSKSKAGPSQYILCYGRGRKKVSATIFYNDLARKWQFSEGGCGPGYATKRELVAAWQVQVETSLRRAGTYRARMNPSAPPVVGGPPVYTPKAPPVHRPVSIPPPPTSRLEKQHASDPFDPRFRDPGGLPTPLGLIVEIKQWVDRYAKRIREISTNLGAKSSPGFNPFSAIIDAVDDCVARYLPEGVPNVPEVPPCADAPDPDPDADADAGDEHPTFSEGDEGEGGEAGDSDQE